MLTRLGGWLYRARWAVLVLAIVASIGLGLYGAGAFNSSVDTGLNDPNSESAKAQDLLDATFAPQGSKSSLLVLLLHDNANLKATEPAFEQATNSLIDKLKEHPEVLTAHSYYDTHSSDFLSHDQRETFVTLDVSTKDGNTTVYNRLKPFITSPDLHIDIGGTLASGVQFNEQLYHDLEFSETVALPIVAVLLVLIFGGLVAAILPLLVGGFAILGSFAVLHVLTNFISVSSFATNVVTIIALGLAIDYSLFMVTRFREELSQNGGDVQRAIQRAMATSGRTVLFSGLTVCTSLLSLLVFPQSVLKSIGLATIASALVAMLGSITILPVLLSLLGTRVNALSIQRLWRKRGQQSVALSDKRGAWYRLSYFVMRWSIPVSLLCILALLGLGTPFLHISFATEDERSLPLNISSRTVAEQLKQNFPNQNDTTIVLAVQTHGDVLTADNLAKMDSYVSDLKNLSHVTKVQSVVSLTPGVTLAQYQQLYAHPALNPPVMAAAQQLAKQNVTKVTLTVDLAAHSNQAKDVVTQVRKLARPAGITSLVGGLSASEMDQFASLGNSLPRAGSIMVVAIFILLFLMTGSLIMPLKAIILNMLSLSATFGALVWIFQDGHLQNLFGFKAFGALDSTQPILVFAIAFGLSMDYEVFLLSRIKEQFDRTGDNREAVATGLQRTGWLITSAAFLLAIVVGAFGTSRIIFIQELGVGLCLAILMDATLVRAILVPAMMNLLGTWNWWAPRPLQWLWLRIGLREPSDEPLENVPDNNISKSDDAVLV
ncbi:MMPL family transporter [Dictyobacter arantiisoli]|uniref:Membrane protein n=1 Tax=Dictyobacter arantiisoli TaxID=2014874 RepID=A0A5A5TJF3_9CHLR|nr:MMPL family transporter [Dictyobacter arantiisoli]GCF11375.1 membrane protein [Dictyobacter arantiisoli]